MNRKNPLLFLAGWLALAGFPPHPAQAADAVPGASSESTGTISGRVQNVVTGRFLHNARVSVKKTDIVVLTDEFGHYRLTNVPSGEVVLDVFYTGLDPWQVRLRVAPGQNLVQDAGLTNAVRYGAKDAIVQLDPVTVAAARETDAAMIAINEQRFASNIKNVVAVNAYGDVVGGNNISDMLKFIPGLQMVGGTSSTIDSNFVYIRGFPPNLTVVTTDGAATSSTDPNGDQRQFPLDGVSINNYSRVEVTKVPTPATGADTMAGSVNLITKRAFEREKAEFRYQVNLTGNSEALTLRKTPYRDETYTYKVNPGFSFDYNLPVSKRFGMVVSAAHSNIFFPQDYLTQTHTATAAGTAATVARPFLSQYQLRDSKAYNQRDSVSVSADWRVGSHSVVSGSAMTTQAIQQYGDAALDFGTGTNGTSTVAGGTAFSYGEDFTSGATGRGLVTYGGVNGPTYRTSVTNGGTVRYAYDDGNWKLDLLGSYSASRNWHRTASKNTFGIITATIKFPVRVVFSDIDPVWGPARTQVFNNANQEIDPYDPNNFNLSTIRSIDFDNRDKIRTGSLDVKRRLHLFSFPTAIQIGGRTTHQTRFKTQPTGNYTYQGLNGDLSSAPYLAKVYSGQKLAFNNVDREVSHPSSHVAWQAWQQNQALFIRTPAQLVALERQRINSTEYIQEKADAYYVQGEVRLFDSRLNVLSGARYERTRDSGEGALQDLAAVWVRNPDGTFANDATGNRIRSPGAGAVGSMEETRLVYKERGYKGSRSYDGLYPSLHFTYSLTDNVLARLAYARTYGRPNFRDIIPNAVVSENDVDAGDTSAVLGTITVRNTGLKPWTADNYDLSVEYYTDSGLVAGNVFHKDITDFFGTFAQVATAADVAALGLEPIYAGWQVNTRINAGDASVTGFELSVNESLRRLGRWGQYFRMFANYTKLKLKGAQEANFIGFLPKSFNAGITFSRKPFVLVAKLNYRGLERRGPFAAYGPGAYNYFPPRTHVDLNFEYILRPRLSLFANAKNVGNAPNENHQWGPETPDYAKRNQSIQYGVPISIGMKGSF